MIIKNNIYNIFLIILIITILYFLICNNNILNHNSQYIENFENINTNNYNDNTTNKNIKLEFIHIPKNAGTSIENFANKFGIKWGRYKSKDEYPLSDNKTCTYYYYHSPFFVRQPNTHYFILVRNPYDRLISEFYYRGGNVYIGKNTKSQLNSKNGTQNNDEENTNNRKIDHINKFYDWFNKIKEIYKSNKYWNNCHILPQHYYIYDKNGNKKVEHIIKIDKNLNDNLDTLFKKYNLNIDVTELKKENSYKKAFNKEDLAQHVLDEIYEIYKDDFKLLKFDKTNSNF